MAVNRANLALEGLIQRYGDDQGPDFRGQPHHRAQMEEWRQVIVDLQDAEAAAAAAAPPVINAAQLNQIIEAVRPPAVGGAAAGPRPREAKVQVLTSTDAKDWRTWKNHITLAIQENDWANPNHDRAKRMVKIHLYGEAEEFTRHINYIPAAVAAANGEDEETYEEFLDRLQSKFLPESAQLQARQLFENSKQRSDEPIGKFHARLMTEFMLAYPHTPVPDADPHIIRKFCYGLRDAAIQAHVMQGVPEDYSECLQLAEARFAVLSAVAGCHKPGGGRISTMEGKESKDAAKSIAKEIMAAMDQRTRTSGAEANRQLRQGNWEKAPQVNPGGKRCYTCKSEYHLAASCPQPALEEGRMREPKGGEVGVMSKRGQKRADAAKKRKASSAKKVSSMETDEEPVARDAATAMLAALLQSATMDKPQ